MKVKIIICAFSIAAAVVTNVAVASGDDFTESDANAMSLYRNGDKDGAIKLWSEMVKYGGIYDPSVKGADMVALHLAKAYYDRLKDDRGNDELLMKIVWYLSKAGVYGSNEVRENVNNLIMQLNNGESEDVYKKTVVKLAAEDVRSRVLEQESVRAEWAKLELKQKEIDQSRAKAKTEMDAANRKISGLERRIEEERKEAQEKMDAANKKIEDLEQGGRSQYQEISKIRKDCDDEKEKIRKKSQQLVLKAKEDISRLRDEKDDIEQRRKDAEERFEKERAEVNKLKAQLEQRSHESPYYMPIPAGFWRGLGTITFSPINYFRCIPQAYSLSEDGFVLAVPFICVWDSIYVVADALMGTVDTLTFGEAGNDYYKDGATPWCWERENNLNEIEKTFYKKREP